MIGGGLYRALKSAGGAVLGTTRRESAEHLHLDFGRPEDFRIPRGVDVTVICAGIGDIAACAASPQETSRVNVSG
ncbi:MAG: RmlD substrate binding domain, partial [Verrucomicrobiota bacterium]